MHILETPSSIEPCLLENINPEISNLIYYLSSAAERLSTRLKPQTASSLSQLVQVMNCYYSNLIEGHKTTPREIEQALANQFDASPERRNLQIEARAHIQLQRIIDMWYSSGQLEEPANTNFIKFLHKLFYNDATDDMLQIEGAGRSFRMMPGNFRSLPEHDVAVGRHIPPESSRVHDFMTYFEKRYQLAPVGPGSRIIAMAAAHHRFNYIHPFPDGNGRVSRLMSHAMALHAGIGAHGLWSISRGLARGLTSRTDYKKMMAYADMPRQGDLDGRGNLSLKALTEFIIWFLKVCLDQIEFMDGLFEFDTLGKRLKLYVEQRNFKPEAFYILEAVLLRGELARGEAERVSNLKVRTARDVLSALVSDGILASETPKSAVFLQFPIATVETLFPKLFMIT